MLMTKILVINGPNLNLLGIREPHIYGDETLDRINTRLKNRAQAEQLELGYYQTNCEADFISHIHQAFIDKISYLILNPASFSHTSIAIRDALLAVAIPFIEVHITNIYNRESYRQKSYLSDIALGIICGLGSYGYFLALEAIIDRERTNGHS